MTTFRESVNNLIRSDKPESTSRAIALIFGISTVGWIWYAMIFDKVTALVAVLAQVLSFVCILLGVKGYNDRMEKKEGAANGQPTDTPAAQ